MDVITESNFFMLWYEAETKWDLTAVAYTVIPLQSVGRNFICILA